MNVHKEDCMANFRNVVVSIGFTALILSLYGADAYGHGGGLDQYGCHNDHQRGGLSLPSRWRRGR